MRSLIGHEYLPYDNSYEANLTNPNDRCRYLAGTHCGINRKVCTIVSEPFKHHPFGGESFITMILVSYNNEIIRTMFSPACVIDYYEDFRFGR